MAAAKLVDINDFMSVLQERGLLIVSAAEFEVGKNLKRKQLMKRKALSLKEIIDHKLLPIGSKEGLNKWVRNGKIKPDETYVESEGMKRIMILTSAIKRLGYED